MTRNARKKFKRNVAPSDEQLWAIGMVCVLWSYVEQLVTAFVHGMTDQDDPHDPDRARFDTTRAMMARLEQWKQLTAERMEARWRDRLLPLINETRQLADLRDKIVHGTWSDKENSSTPPTGEAHGAFSWGRPGKPFTWRLTYDDIVRIALRIDAHHSNLFSFCADAAGIEPGQPNFTVGNAVRRVSRVPKRS
jgi:hypothetical protein